MNRQVLIPLVAVCLMAAVCLAGLSQYIAARQAAEQSRARLASVAASLENTSFPINSQVLGILRSLSGFEFVVCDADGQLRGHSSGLTSDSANAALGQASITTRRNLGVDHSQATELRIDQRAYRATILNRPLAPDAILLLLEPQAERQSIQQQLALIPLISGLVTLVLVGAVALLLSRRLVKRIMGLEQSVRAIATGTSERIPITGPRDELTQLAQSVNGMADELRSVWKTIRETERSRLLSQVAGGLAHQLRNAITGIHLAVQLHRRDCPMANQESLAVAEAELSRTAAYIQQLLHSAAGKQAATEPSELSVVLDESQSLLSTIATHRRIELQWQRDLKAENFQVPNRELIRSAIMNLVLNALDAAGPGGDVIVVTLSEHNQIIIRVSDSGPGPSPEFQEHLFDAFVSSKPEGLGVGLTVVRSAAQSLGGSVNWQRQSDRTLFEIAIPRGAA